MAKLLASGKLSKEEKEEIHIFTAKFIFGCNLPFVIVENVYFKELVKRLCPSYDLPCVKYLSEGLLNKTFDLLQPIKHSKREGTLMIDGWKNPNKNQKVVVAMVKPTDEKEILIDSYDFTSIPENYLNLKEVIIDATLKAEEKFNIVVSSVCTDNAANMRKASRESNLINYGCICHIGDLLLNDIHDKILVQDVRSVLVCFRKPNLQQKVLDAGGSSLILRGETRWKGEKDELICFTKNFDHIQLIAENSSDEEVSSNVKGILDQENLLLRIQNEIKLHNPICHIIDEAQKREGKLGDVLENWTKLKLPDKHKNQKALRDKMVYSEAGLLANVFHPKYKGSSLNLNQLAVVDDTVRKKLRNSSEFQIYWKYRANEDEFNELALIDLSPTEFWTTFLHHCPVVSTLALTYTSLPASTALLERSFSQWSYVHNKTRNRLGGEKSKKLFFIYHALSLNQEK